MKDSPEIKQGSIKKFGSDYQEAINKANIITYDLLLATQYAASYIEDYMDEEYKHESHKALHLLYGAIARYWGIPPKEIRE